ncbi:MAG: tetratricopeptide repeat protein, partial [Bacteroidia bacterium]
MEDTTSVNPLVDSLKQEFLKASATVQLNLLGELAENWRPNSYGLATEEMRQSKTLNDKNGEGDALCKLGIYYCRRFNLDSADYFLNLAEELAKTNRLDNILAQSISWQAEVLRQSGGNDKALEMHDQALAIAEKIGDKKRMAFCYVSKGESYKIKSEFGKALDCYSKAIGFATAVHDLNKIAICYNGMGDAYRLQNNYPKALENFNKGLEIAKKNRNKNQIAFCLSCMGDIYSAQNESAKALQFYKDAYHIAAELGLKLQECNSLSSMGMAYFLLNEYDKALDCFGKALPLAEQISNKDKMAFILSTTGEIYKAQKDYDKALERFNRTIGISNETGNKNQLAISYEQIGECYFSARKFTEALNATEKSLAIARETRAPESVKNAARLLSNIYAELHDPGKSLSMLHLFIQMKDSIGNEEQVKQFAAVEYKAKEDGLKAEQKAREATYKAEEARKEEELKRQKTIRYAFTIGFALVLMLALVVYRGLQQNKKQNRIISAQKKEMEHQKELVEEKNKEIIDSITYAKRLQDAILPPVKMVKQWFPESFVLYKPKDIIAGDFYWMEHIGDLTFFAAADSTGHGVPGAMVSVVCSNALNRAIKEFRLDETGKILDKTRELVLETFEK